MPVLEYKMIVVKFNGITYRLSDTGWTGIDFEKYTDLNGWFPLDADEIAEEMTALERFDMEMLFD